MMSKRKIEPRRHFTVYGKDRKSRTLTAGKLAEQALADTAKPYHCWTVSMPELLRVTAIKGFDPKSAAAIHTCTLNYFTDMIAPSANLDDCATYGTQIIARMRATGQRKKSDRAVVERYFYELALRAAKMACEGMPIALTPTKYHTAKWCDRQSRKWARRALRAGRVSCKKCYDAFFEGFKRKFLKGYDYEDIIALRWLENPQARAISARFVHGFTECLANLYE